MTNKMRYYLDEGFVLLATYDKRVLFRSVLIDLQLVKQEYDKKPLVLSEVNKYAVRVQDEQHAKNLLDNWYEDMIHMIITDQYVHLINALPVPKKPAKRKPDHE